MKGIGRCSRRTVRARQNFQFAKVTPPFRFSMFKNIQKSKIQVSKLINLVKTGTWYFVIWKNEQFCNSKYSVPEKFNPKIGQILVKVKFFQCLIRLISRSWKHCCGLGRCNFSCKNIYHLYMEITQKRYSKDWRSYQCLFFHCTMCKHLTETVCQISWFC